ncbi:MAG: alpha-1,4-glucan--maltose-1-phosphate maltosyltransferase [bacterium]
MNSLAKRNSTLRFEGIEADGRKRVVIENVYPEIDGGRFPIRRVIGEKVVVQADVFSDGHDEISAVVLYRQGNDQPWQEAPMNMLVNDRWEAAFMIEEMSFYSYTLQGWVDYFATWQKDLQKKYQAGQDVAVELLLGAGYVQDSARRILHDGAPHADVHKLEEFASLLKEESDVSRAVSLALSRELTLVMKAYPDKSLSTFYRKELMVVVDRAKALFSTWYELFPRSWSPDPTRSGTFNDCKRLLPEISRMGFNVLYLPPVHPIGRTNRKGSNNSPISQPNDPGSPWAIGSAEGGHKSLDPSLGTLDDFRHLAWKAGQFDLEIAIDLAFQCSPDHPYIREHPEWFKKRPDGSIQYAENPPKKYEDIVPLNFETEHWKELWEELKSVVLFWIDQGVRIFRVDNPHTKPFAFWEWLISGIKKDYHDVIFLSEAFTRPKVMYRLAKIGFTQSYTYFTWRNTKAELTSYLEELQGSEAREYFRPNFWPNTPDILPEYLQYGGRPAFIIRYVLAATLSSNCGIFGPVFELCVNEALPEREEYLNSEKYEIKHWSWDRPGRLNDVIATVNRIRKQNPALWTTWNLKFYEVNNDYLLFYGKRTEDFSNIILVIMNLDPHHTQSGYVTVPIHDLGIDPHQPYLVHDLISDDKYVWYGVRNYVELNPSWMPVHILRLHRRLKREVDFDYFM